MVKSFPGKSEPFNRKFRKFQNENQKVYLATLSFFRKLCEFAIFCSTLVLLVAITTIIPDKDDGDVYLKMD